MWLTGKTDARFFNRLFELTEKKNWQQVKLHSAGIYKTHPTDIYIDGFNVARIDNKESDFLMSHQVTLWNKEFLQQQLHKGEHPWRNERKATKRLKQLSPEIFHIDYFEENGNREINLNRQPVERSSYYTVSANGSFNDNIRRYISELLASDELYAKKLEYNYTHQLVHDGQQRPRKTDIFKRIKNWILKK